MLWGVCIQTLGINHLFNRTQLLSLPGRYSLDTWRVIYSGSTEQGNKGTGFIREHLIIYKGERCTIRSGKQITGLLDYQFLILLCSKIGSGYSWTFNVVGIDSVYKVDNTCVVLNKIKCKY